MKLVDKLGPVGDDPAPAHHPPGRLRSATLDPQTQRQVNARINRLLREADRAEVETLRDVSSQLGDLQGQVRELIAAEGGATGYAELLTELDRRITEKHRTISRRIATAIADAASAGVELVDEATQIATSAAAAVTTPPIDGQVRRIQLRAAQLVVTAQEELRMGVANQVLMLDTGDRELRQVLDAFGTKVVGSRVFGGPAMKVRQVTTTETGHAHGAGVRAAAEAPPSGVVVKKRWIWSHDPTGGRPGHAEAERRYAPGGSIGPIWPDEDFIVGGFRTPYPRGPGLPGVEKLNCGCRSVPVVERIEETTG